MERLSPFARQILVAIAPQLAGLSVGGVIGYPNVILEQFKANDSTIQVDLDVASWIGSAHGLAGIPSVFMPALMQWRGRKMSFFASCLLINIGWIITYFAKSASTILAAEFFHGLGSNSIIIASLYSISEMIDPKYRLISMSFYLVNEALGICVVGIMGRYLHWRTVAIVMAVPIFISLIIGCVSPESPSWLAYVGKYEKCKKSFNWLRGSDERSFKELMALINSQREQKHQERNRIDRSKYVWGKIKRRDFYLPCLQTFVCLSLFYNGGTMVLIIYAIDMIRMTTKNNLASFYGMICIDVIVFAGCFTTVFLLKYFKNKSVLLWSGFGSSICMFLATIVSYLQQNNVVRQDSLLFVYCLISFTIVNTLGVSSMSFSVSAELMPVKHRGLGGSFYVFLTCVMHFFCLKVSPYLFLYLEIWGTLLIYALNAFFCSLYIWRYVPETKNRTLQEIENFYANGNFVRKFIETNNDNNDTDIKSLNTQDI